MPVYMIVLLIRTGMNYKSLCYGRQIKYTCRWKLRSNKARVPWVNWEFSLSSALLVNRMSMGGRPVCITFLMTWPNGGLVDITSIYVACFRSPRVDIRQLPGSSHHFPK